MDITGVGGSAVYSNYGSQMNTESRNSERAQQDQQAQQTRNEQAQQERQAQEQAERTRVPDYSNSFSVEA